MEHVEVGFQDITVDEYPDGKHYRDGKGSKRTPLHLPGGIIYIYDGDYLTPVLDESKELNDRFLELLPYALPKIHEDEEFPVYIVAKHRQGSNTLLAKTWKDVIEWALQFADSRLVTLN